VFKEFKEFVMKGSMLDMAVGIVLGAAFGSIIASFVKDVLMPPIGLALGRVDFSSLFIDLSGTGYASLAEAQKAGAPTLNYGLFLNSVINFLIIAWALFLVVRAVNRLRREPEAAPDTQKCPFCLSSIPAGASRCAHCTSEVPGLKA